MGGEPSERVEDTSAGPETAVVVAVDVAGLETIYRDSYPAVAQLGIPLHVTLLYPFAPPEELESALPLLQAVLARHERFTFELAELRTFPRAVWIAPEPATPFVALTEAIEAAFPQYPRYGGQFAEVIPHLTLADQLEEADLALTVTCLRALVDPLLPVEVTADEATVLAEQPSGQWLATARLPLGTTG